MSELTVEEQITAAFNGEAVPDAPPAEPEPDNGAEPQEPEQGPAEVETGEPEPEAQPEEPLLAGRFRTPEELERGYEELNKKLGEQGQQLGEARRLAEEVAALREQIQPQQTQPQYDPNSIDDWIAQNPQQIPALAQQAIDTNDGYLYQRALAAWGELDQFGATDFHARQIAAAEVARVREEMQPALQGLQRVETTNQLQQAWDTAASRHDDFAGVLSSITQDTLDGFPPEVLGVLQTGDQASKERVLETLYRWQKAEQAGNLTAAAAQAVTDQHEASRQARAQAQVATTTASPERTEPAPRSQFIEAFEASDAFKKAAGLI